MNTRCLSDIYERNENITGGGGEVKPYPLLILTKPNPSRKTQTISTENKQNPTPTLQLRNPSHMPQNH